MTRHRREATTPQMKRRDDILARMAALHPKLAAAIEAWNKAASTLRPLAAEWEEHDSMLRQWGEEVSGPVWQRRHALLDAAGDPLPGKVTEHRACTDWLKPWEDFDEVHTGTGADDIPLAEALSVPPWPHPVLGLPLRLGDSVTDNHDE